MSPTKPASNYAVPFPAMADAPCREDCFRERNVPIWKFNGHGTRHMVTRFVVPVYNSDKKIKGCFTVLQGYSTVSDLIQRVEHQERTLKIIFDSIDVGIFTVNKGGHVTFFNTAVEKISGYNRRQVLGKNCSMIFGANDKTCESSLEKTMIKGKSLIICQEQQIDPRHLTAHIQDRIGTGHKKGISSRKVIPPNDDMEARQIIRILKLHHGNRKKSAQELGINRTTLWRKMKRFNILL